jgi:hypothetical protein
MKTVAIKVEDDVHARLLLMAQLSATSLTDVVRQAVDRYVADIGHSEDLAAKAQGLLDAIEEESLVRKQAVQALLGQLDEATPTTSPARTRRPRRS